ncbi:MAG TPA: ComEA family DNA-binding protein [Pseudonocardiaceae bacterium]|jgi:competence protein ComEA
MKPNYPNTNSRDHVRERLVNLASELSPDARTTTRNTDEPIPIFTWPRTKDPDDPDTDIVDIEMTAPPENGAPPTDPEPDLLADTRAGPAGQLVERWLPGGNRTVDGVRSLVRRHRGAVLAVVGIGLVAAIIAGVAMASSRPETEAAPALPAAVSAMANSSSVPARPANTHIVISVVGKVVNPGLVTLADGARVADAVQAAGGVLPGTDVTALNMARKLADGEQIYVGIPVPAGAADPTVPADADTATASTSKSKKGKAPPGQKVDLNTASANDLETLPGVGDATAQRIVTWRSQHGSFNSIDQLRSVGGIGDGKFAKIKDLVTI